MIEIYLAKRKNQRAAAVIDHSLFTSAYSSRNDAPVKVRNRL